MASGGGSPGGKDRKAAKMSSLSEPRPKKRPVPRFDTELSLNTELRRAEDSMNYRSLPNNLGWSLEANGYMPERGTSSGSQRKSKHFEQVKLQETAASPESPKPTEFKRKKHHTPATIPRTKLLAGTPIAERLALERLRQHLTFGEDEIPSRGPSTSAAQDAVALPSQSSAANNERAQVLSRPGGTFQIPVRETNETDTTQAVGGTEEIAGEQVDASKILERLKQVKDFLKQATGMFVSMNTGGSDVQRTRDFEQAAKLARLIKHLKKQERAYTNLLQRSIAVEDDSATENTPSLSLHSFSEDEKSESHSAHDEELQGLRQQHALLHKMLEQQKQLKELQTRQAALLTLQRDAEQRLAEAEEEDGHIADGIEEGAVGGAEYDTASGRSRSGTEASEATAEGSTDDWGFTPEQFALHNFIQRTKEKFRADEEKDRDEGNQRKKKKNQQAVRVDRGPTMDLQSSSDVQPDNEEAALAMADAAQERLELENKLMALQAKKEQMDSLLTELQQLREAQLRKETLEGRKPPGSSVNEAKQDNDDEKPLATTSQKLDDDSILEALEVHEKLRRLQDVRQHLKQLRDMIGHYQESAGPEGDLNLQDGLGALAEDSAPESGRADETEEERGAVGGAVSSATGPDNSSMDWILNYGIDDPELIGKLRQLQAARERVLHLKQTNQMAQLPVGTSRLHNETSNPQLSQSQTEDSETDGTTTDTESNASHASSSLNALAWQDDPEFQEKITKLNSAKKKLKQLQELVKRVQQFPDGAPMLPTELAELSFDEVDDDGDDDSKDEDSEQSSSSSDEEEDDDDEQQAVERNSGMPVGDRQSSQRVIIQNLQGIGVSEQEAEYQLRLQKQKNELDSLLEERRRLLEMQQQLSRLTQQQNEGQKAPAINGNSSHASAEIPVKNPSKARTSNSGSPSLIRTDTFTVNRPSIPVPVRHVSDSATQTQSFEQPLRTLKSNKSYSVDSGEPPQGGTTSSALVWSELRRQRELHEEKLKKRKHRLLNEKRKKAGLDDVSEGGAYSLRSADVDEGFGVSMMSADITTATWGGSTQPSSTQNDSAVSEDESEEENQEGKIAVEVEDDYPDGIVQAEEEEEERDEQDTYPGGAADVFRSRERVPRSYGIGRSSLEKKRSRGARKKELSWPKIDSDRSPRQRLRQQNFTPADQLIEEREREQFILERQAWEQQCGQLHEEVAKLTNMCNNLLRDQQSLITALIGRNNLGAGPQMTPMSATTANDPNPYQQYQQKQQEAYQSLQSYFDNQRHLLQQQQLVQTLNQCYMQLNNQQQDLNFLQGKFQQLFSCNSNPPSAGPSPLPRYDMPGTSPGYPFPAAAAAAASTLQPNGMPSFSFTGSSNAVPTTFPSLPVYSGAGFNTTYSYPTASRPSASHNFTYSPFQTSATANDSLNPRDIPWPVPPSSGQASAAAGQDNIQVPSWVPVFSDASRFPSVHTQTEHVANPETGVPSPRFGAFGSQPSSFASTPAALAAGDLPSLSRYGAVRFPSVHTQTERTASPRFGAFGGHPPSLASTTAAGVSGLPPSSRYGDVATSTDVNLLRSYDPSAYAEASTAAFTRPTAQNEVVVGRSFPTPLRAQAVANLANKDLSSQTTKLTRPLKRGFDSVETSSQTSSVPGEAQDPAKRASQDIDRASDAGSEFSLFEALRDSIYSEVATLISLNESRPHFLIELFRELQLLTSDYLRQRALYALRDIVTRFLTEDSLTSSIVDKTAQQTRFQAWTGSNSELTPSETVETSEDENGRDEAVSAQVVTEGIYDYVENVESGSTLSTPTSSQTGDAPFASEGLGETVIHFDEALHKMREYEQLRAEGKLRQLDTFTSHGASAGASNKQGKDDVTTSSAGDMGSDSSFSDVQYPRIDTQALDHQIKSIMSEVIPYLNEHMEDTCTAELMGYIRGLVLSRIRVREEQEFGRFFHKQLASILHDSLSKFERRKMKDCGEDMLVDMSEILFNELAFFRLMQDLDGSGTRGRRPFWRQEVESGTDTGTGQEADKEDEGDAEEKEQQPEDSATEETESTTREKPEDDKDENKDEQEEEEEEEDNESSDDTSSEDSDAEDEAAADDEGAEQEDTPIPKEEKEAEEEELGKDRDDDMAAQFEDMPESSKENASESQQCVKLELSVSESKPFASAGSGEEDGEESYDDLQSKRTLEECEGGTAAGRDREQGSDSDESDDSNAPQDDQAQATAAAAAAAAAVAAAAATQDPAQATRPEHLQNGQLTEDHDDFEVILDDLPTKLTGLTEADLQARIAEEQSRTEGAQGVLRHIDGEPELAGDGNALREPEPPTNPVNDSQEGEN